MEDFEAFALSFNNDGQRLAVGSYNDSGPSNLSILDGKNHELSKIQVEFPVTAIQWSSQLLATTSERLRIYNDKFEELWCVSASNSSGPPPLTSLDWNKSSSQWLLTSSVDTTCTLWDLSRQKPSAHTRLIAHDAEVLDVGFLSGSTALFASCSTDGSLRLFDLRNLNQSTIAYEPTLAEKVSLLRLSVSQANPNYIALLQANSSNVVIVDLRNVGAPLTIIDSKDTVVSASWHPQGELLMTATEGGSVLLYDVNNSTNPNMICDVAQPINAATWSPWGSTIGVATRHGVCRVLF